MAITEAQKASVRRHLRFAVGGLNRNSPGGGSLASGGGGYRWNQAFGALEYKMNNLSPTEECILTGQPYGAVALMGPIVDGSGNPVPAPGNTVVVTFSGAGLVGTHPVTTTAVAGDSLLTLAVRIAATVNLDTTMQAAGIYALAPFGTGPFATGSYGPPGGNPAGNQAIPLPEAAFISSQGNFQVVSVTSSGVIGAAITAAGVQLPPSAAVDWTALPYAVSWGYLPILDKLEGNMLNTTQNLDLAQAGGPEGVTYRKSQKRETRQLYREFCSDLVTFLFGTSSEDGMVGERNFSGNGMRVMV